MLRSVVRRSANFIANRIDAPVLVLLYHRVTNTVHDPHLLAITSENFRDHVNFLKKNLPILRFEDDWQNKPRPAVVITFDDGYADNYLEALPILEQAEVPACFFIASGHVGKDHEYWPIEIYSILTAGTNYPDSIELPLGTWPTNTYEGRILAYRDLRSKLKEMEFEPREEVLGQIREWCAVDSKHQGRNRPLSMDELKQLAASPLVTIGSHTVSHPSLGRLSVQSQETELYRSKADLENWLGKEVASLSYPFGRDDDYDAATMNICRKTGYKKAAANIYGQVHTWTDPYQIPRIIMRNWPIQQFQQLLRFFWT